MLPPAPPLVAPSTIPAPVQWPVSDHLGDWALLPSKPDWASGFRAEWTPGEAGALERLEDFADHARRYADQRNLPARAGTSRLSPHLHFGEVSPAAVWHRVAGAGGSVGTFLGELGWRDYGQNVIMQ